MNVYIIRLLSPAERAAFLGKAVKLSERKSAEQHEAKHIYLSS